MKANEALNLLRISRKTLHVYVSTGKIRFTVMPNGFYDYNDEDIYKLLNKDVKQCKHMPFTVPAGNNCTDISVYSC